MKMALPWWFLAAIAVTFLLLGVSALLVTIKTLIDG